MAEYNYDKLCTLGAPIATIQALHSDPVAIWQQAGLCNGSAGTIYMLLYQEGHQPPSLPIAVLVQFDLYTGPTFIDNVPNCVPITPLTFEWEKHSRRQLPLQLWYAITIHKSQGQFQEQSLILAVADLEGDPREPWIPLFGWTKY